ncbi:hypothetical protein FNW52_12415 [Flavobacterium sp. ZT3R18]|uniref:hypothetical protein n=1 Tax=Flavobacterium sp. ZT3R18 TaxID=2594429 RepID=UPI00117B125D|nr:hypothetical protein [Flavobacterium sp. ZT3R18]TRX34939.1 hypothetical protein FNW52_12415 [Flavobacterium sp. ZT3R18]
MNTLTKEQWLKKIEYKNIIRNQNAFSNATLRTIEIGIGDLELIQNDIQDYELKNEGTVDNELLTELLKEVAYGFLKSSPRRYTIKYAHWDGYKTRITNSVIYTKY